MRNADARTGLGRLGGAVFAFSPVMLLMLLFTLLISLPKGLGLTPFCCPFFQILSQQFQSERTYNLQPRDLRLVVN